MNDDRSLERAARLWIEVGPTRQRGADGDPVMVRLHDDLTTMLAGLKERGRPS